MKKLGVVVLLWSVLQGGAWAGVVEGWMAYEKQHYVTALRELRPLAEAGNKTAQMLLGLMYTNGEGVPKNRIEAIKWYRLAADQGDVSMQFLLGSMYANGLGAPKSDVEAARWYRLAADQGNAMAQFKLGVMYSKGEGVAKSDVEAVKWFRRAADQGDARAQNNLGTMYEDGEGVVKNKTVAYALFNLAAVNLSSATPVANSRDLLEQELTPAQRLTAQAISIKLQNSDDFLRTLDEAVRQTTGK